MLRNRNFCSCYSRIKENIVLGRERAGKGVSLVSSLKEALKSDAIVFCCFRKAIHVFSTAEGLLTQNDKITADGLQEVFETNIFGHFILVKRLWA